MARRNSPQEAVSQSRVVRALRRYITESDLYIGSASRGRDMHRTDLNGLGLVMDWEYADDPATPGRLGAALGLSAPATSALLDRLERAGHVTRSPHPSDRRSVVVAATDHALEVGGEMFRPLAQRIGPIVASRTEEQLQVIAEFLEEVGEATATARRDVESG